MLMGSTKSSSYKPLDALPVQPQPLQLANKCPSHCASFALTLASVGCTGVTEAKLTLLSWKMAENLKYPKVLHNRK